MRDRERWTEMDSSTFNHFYVDVLAEFARSKFIMSLLYDGV